MPDPQHVVEAVDAELPEMARRVIHQYLDPSDPETEVFSRDPDGRDQHQTDWHQWGIITHTRRFLNQFDTDVPAYLRSWGLWTPVHNGLGVQIDSVSKWDLLRVAILLHDIGKFGARKRGKTRFHFAAHERLSGRIIRQEARLERHGLTASQIEYVARTAENHFVLAEVRKNAREEGAYDLQFTRGPDFVRAALSIVADHPDDYIEVGVLFLGDNISKVDPKYGPTRAVSQYELNIEVAHRYLQLALESSNL